jgi:hypothetical protein
MRIPDPTDQASQDHRLWWQPGTAGRGVLFESGLVCTWPEGDATHRQYAEQVPSKPVMFFYIRPDGRVRIPERHAHRAPRLAAALAAADPRLAPFAPPRHAGPAAAPPSERPPCATPTAVVGSPAARRSIYHAWDEQAPARLARIQRRY